MCVRCMRTSLQTLKVDHTTRVAFDPTTHTRPQLARSGHIVQQLSSVLFFDH